MLLLCDFEQFFLQDLKDLPVQAFALPDGFPRENTAVKLALSKVDGNMASRERAEQAFERGLGRMADAPVDDSTGWRLVNDMGRVAFVRCDYPDAMARFLQARLMASARADSGEAGMPSRSGAGVGGEHLRRSLR